jgi:hypothetical protein
MPTKAGLAARRQEKCPMTESMPAPEPNGFIKTLNNMGYMTSTLDPYSRQFVDFALIAPGPALDVGAAYGVATLAALKAGAHILANDIEPRHLEILSRTASAEDRERLTLKPGAYPERLNLEPHSLGAALVCRVLHFFDGPAIERAAASLFLWLKPGGKVFVVAETPYLRNFRTFIPIYEERKKAGDPWPGYVSDVMAIAPERGKSLPPRIHFLDPEVLSRVFSAAGFRIEKAATIPRPDFPSDLQWDGRESVGLIAVKP